MQKKSFVQVMIIVVFALMAAGSATTSNSSRSSRSSSTYYRPSTQTQTQKQTPTNSPMKIEKTEFPKPACKTCQGRKGYYLFDIWCPCKRCGGTGLEPEH